MTSSTERPAPPGARAATPVAAAAGVPPSWLTAELWLVFALSLGASGVRALVDLLADATSGKSLTSQVALLNVSKAPGRPWVDLALQLVGLATGVVPVFLVAYFLHRSRESMATIGVDRREPARDGIRGALLAAIVGGAGLGLYLGTHAAGVDLTVVPESLPHIWWRIPVLVLSALQNATLEEVLVAGFLLHRLRQLGWGDNRALVLSAVIRGSYHLYQGLGGFAGNAVMGLIFGRLYQRWGRVAPLIVAHTLMDTVAFVGYAELAGHVSWLPTP
ncbi:MAG TPA: CPBP family intramembrane glutamic endopeptidase [Mycobacteriales bacterium]|nr:CPBP family intramembrane glutamic endopeptidase [Mycobacteriales bacterium]